MSENTIRSSPVRNGLNTREYYQALSARLAPVGQNSGEFAPAFDVLKKLCSLLENKADFGVRLQKAYLAKDIAVLSALMNECDLISKKLQALRSSHRAAWMTYHKSFGWEVHDIRYGGLLMRFDTTKERIRAYLAGELSAIEELEAPSLRLDGTALISLPEDGWRFAYLTVGFKFGEHFWLRAISNPVWFG